MKPFITNIHINELLHLRDFDIPVADVNHPHLMITGKNGSGKTILLRALVDFLDKIKGDAQLSCLAYDENIDAWKKTLQMHTSESGKASARQSIQIIQKQKQELYGKISLKPNEIQSIIESYNANNLILAFYAADRMVSFKEPKNPQKPDIRRHLNIKETSTDQLLIFLVDLKIQEALLRNEKELDEADRLGKWFESFQKLIREIYQDDNLHIRFNPRTYQFFIQTNGKEFKFTQMSDGYAAIIDIVADLILKMQDDLNSISSVYDKAGIVIIDEIETHLHLELQKLIMPMLTQMFPNIQFIVTTHSPFVLNSISNASVFDLEHRQMLEDLSDYSYEALAEGYFGVTTESSTVEMRLNKLKTLLEMKEWTPSEMNYIRQLMTELDKISEAVSPDFVGAYRQLLLKYVARLNDIRK
jgi:predicted ATP-binding protein involved in virulence